MSTDRPLDKTYYLWARDKRDAIKQGSDLATAKGWKPYHVEAERYKLGADYHVNWRVVVYIEPVE